MSFSASSAHSNTDERVLDVQFTAARNPTVAWRVPAPVSAFFAETGRRL
jgi:hypothetical protein